MTVEKPIRLGGYQAGDVFESRDDVYEPGRRIQLREAVGDMHWQVETVANPRRPHMVGTRARIAAATLRTKWRAL